MSNNTPPSSPRPTTPPKTETRHSYVPPTTIKPPSPSRPSTQKNDSK